MMEQYINGKLTPHDEAQATSIQKRHISYPFKQKLSTSDSLRLDSIKRVNHIKDSLRLVREKQNMEAKQRERELKAEREAKEKEKRQQPLNDPIIKADEEVRIRTEKEDKDKDKDKKDKEKNKEKANSKKKDNESRKTNDKQKAVKTNKKQESGR